MTTITTKLDNTIIIGEAIEIKAVYNSMVRAWKADKYSIKPLYRKPPKYCERGMYGIVITIDDWDGTPEFHVINADTVLRSVLASNLI